MLKVVIIDGNAISRGLLSSVLAGGGHEVVGDGNTSHASLVKLIALRPQIVCVDIGTHDEQGVMILKTLTEALPKALIFLVSGKFDEAMVKVAAQHGVHGFIVKPFNGVTVLNTIRKAVLKLVRTQMKDRADSSATNATPEQG